MSGDNGEIKKKAQKVIEPEEGHLGKVTIDGKEVKIVDTTTVIEIRVHKLENGKELSQVVAHEFMMTDHKSYMIMLLTEAINTVMKAIRRTPALKVASQAIMNRIKREFNQKRRNGGGFGKG